LNRAVAQDPFLEVLGLPNWTEMFAGTVQFSVVAQGQWCLWQVVWITGASQGLGKQCSAHILLGVLLLLHK